MKATIEVVITYKIKVPVANQAEAERIRAEFESRMSQGFPEIELEGVVYYPDTSVDSGIPFVDLNW